MAHRVLDLRERSRIEDMLRAKMTVDEIAAVLGRHRSTIYREIGRNRFVDPERAYLTGYWGMVAQNKAEVRRARRRSLDKVSPFSIIDNTKGGSHAPQTSPPPATGPGLRIGGGQPRWLAPDRDL